MNAFGEHSRHRFFGGVFRFMVWLLICTFFLPAPLAVNAAPALFRSDTDPAGAHVLHRLNGPERKAAIEEARRIDAAAREAFAKGEDARGEGGGIISPPSPLALSTSTPHNGVDDNSAAVAQSPETGLQGPEALAGVARRGGAPSVSSARPRSIGEIMFNAATGMVGLPGLADPDSSLGGAARRGSALERQGGANRALPGSHLLPRQAWNEDQGLGFHADGTARRADGTTGDNAAGAGYDGRRAASYANHGAGSGLGYSPYGPYGSMGGNGLYVNEPGYDPVTGQNFRYGDPTSGGRRAMGQGGQGGYGNLDQFDPTRMMLDRGLNYGVGMVNSAAEGLFLGLMDNPYGGAKARFNFMVDWDGKINGEGDVLLPWYDSKYTTVYSQLGARSMSGASGGGEDGRGADRWIGNVGLGQRWYPYAVNEGTGEDAGNLMLGYNAFFDNDFTRSHQRGGLGIEGQYDWLHLASNYYVPLSSWKNSKDFDGDFVKERPAEGWDIRAKGYLPFYRNVAVTGAYTQWYGDHVGMFGAANLEKDPKVWSYGLEYTPIPLVSGFVNQRSTEHGRSDTELGLRFTYYFQMPWEEQIRHDKVAELRTVGASRHEFVDRENRIILEYKAKNAYRIEYLGVAGNNVFKFRILNGFNEYKAGQQVRVSAGGGVTLAEAPTSPVPAPAQGAPEKTFLARAGEALVDFFSVSPAHAADFWRTYTSDRNGEFLVTVTAVSSGPVTLTVQAGDNTQSFAVNVTGTTPTGPYVEIQNNNAPADNSSLITARARFFEADGSTPASGQTVNWSVQGVTPAGIILGTASQTDSTGWSSITVKDGQTGNRSVTLDALYGGTTRTVTVQFGAPVLSLTNIAASLPNPAIEGSSTITADVKFADGSSAANLPDTSITWKTRNNASTSATVTTSHSGTNASGVASFPATANFQHVMYVEASAGSSSQNTTVQFGPTLPSEFIVGPGGAWNDPFIGKTLDWSAAGAFCAAQGGQLPAHQEYLVAGGFPNGNYWTREELSSNNLAYRLLSTSNGLVPNSAQDETVALLVICVP